MPFGWMLVPHTEFEYWWLAAENPDDAPRPRLRSGSASNVFTSVSGANGPWCASSPAMNTRAET